jgi:prevent-host-death family protein
MKTATVRELRNRFAAIAERIENGQQVTITRNGAVFATLTPVKPSKRRKADWAARFKRSKPVGRKLTRAETEAFWRSLRAEH